MNKKTLVISIDALISDDIPLLETLPNLGPIVKGAAQVRDIECIYPCLLYTSGSLCLGGRDHSVHHHYGCDDDPEPSVQAVHPL